MSHAGTLKDHRASVIALADRFGVTNLRVFGSVAEGRDTEQSDIDILVDARPGVTLFDLGGLHDALETLLGVPVDLLTPGDISPKFRDSVIASARPI